MIQSLSLRDLTLPGEPLDSAELLTGEAGLQKGVSWAVSLRPYSPAFPRLRGGELALVATENLARLDPPITLSDVVRLLAATGAAAVAVRGKVEQAAVQVAQAAGLPLFALPPDAPLADIEQAVMRECALYQARSEVHPPQEPDSWFEDLLSERPGLREGAVSRAERLGYAVSALCCVVFITPMPSKATEQQDIQSRLRQIAERLQEGWVKKGENPVSARTGGGLAILLPMGSSGNLHPALAAAGECLACGIGSVRSLLEATTSLAEAKLAATASAYIYEGAATRYSDLGALHMLLLLHRDHRSELNSFVEETVGPLLMHDAGSSMPLLPTVRTFIEHGGRLRETAGALFVHRNTLAYRLERAADILGMDVRAPDARLAVELALRVLPLLGRGDGM